MNEVNTRCVCQSSGREQAEHRVTNHRCFQHGDWGNDELAKLSFRDNLLYLRYRAPYFSNAKEERDWWCNRLNVEKEE